MSNSFSDLKVRDAIKVMDDIGDIDTKKELEKIVEDNSSDAELRLSEVEDSKFLKPWKIKEHAFGFLDEKNRDENKIPIINALTMDADMSLKGKRVNIRVGNVNVERYPGLFGGVHNVLFEFSAKHSPDNEEADDEDIKYTQNYKLRNHGGGSKQGLSVLKGLRVPRNGLDFYLNTIYLGNESEEAIVDFLDSGIFNSGLELISSVNPVIKQVAGYATGITKYLVERKKNKIVQEIGLGFDFAGNPGVASLKKGMYLALQTNLLDLNWAEWYYDTNNSLIKPYDAHVERLPKNFISFIISEFEEEN